MATSRRSDIINLLVTELKKIDGGTSDFDSDYTSFTFNFTADFNGKPFQPLGADVDGDAISEVIFMNSPIKQSAAKFCCSLVTPQIVTRMVSVSSFSILSFIIAKPS